MKKLKSKKGAVALETVLAITLTLPILMSFLFGGYAYYTAQSKNINLNFEVGRYASTMGECSVERMSLIPKTAKYSNYEFRLIMDNRETCLNCNGNGLGLTPPSNPDGIIMVTCNSSNWETGAEFGVATEYYFKYFPQAFNFFPSKSFEGATYVVE